MLLDGPYFNSIGLLIVTLIILIMAICLLAIYTSFKEGSHSDADIAAGSLTIVFNVLMAAFAILLVVQQYCGKTDVD